MGFVSKYEIDLGTLTKIPPRYIIGEKKLQKKKYIMMPFILKMRLHTPCLNI